MTKFKKAALVANLALILGLMTPLTPAAQASVNAATLVSATAKPDLAPTSSALVIDGIPTGHLNVTVEDLKYILDQIKIGEAHSARTATANTALSYGASTPSVIYPYDVTSATRCLIASDLTTAATAAYGPTGLSNNYTYLNTSPWGVRQVDGQCNNITNVQQITAPITTGADVNNPVVPQPTAGVPTDTGAWGAADQLFSRLTPAKNADKLKLAKTPSSIRDTDTVKHHKVALARSRKAKFKKINRSK